ncbi:MAG TPA: hypothetical protein VD999_02700 [Vitreimonas sp.]|nr:hypothetical protein [Vitreimonas sp.]
MPKNVTLAELEAAEERAQEIEDEREAKKAEREEKKRLKELKKKREAQEKLVAPFLLFLSIVVSLVLYIIYGR